MIRIEVLGAPVLRGPDGPVTGRAAYRRRVALLSILAAARGRPVGRERLIGLLWPEQRSESARHALSEALYVLRKELGEDAFVSHGDDVGLNPARVGSDLEDFERELEAGSAEAAVELYRGPFLEGFYVADAPEFERWAEAERDRLARARVRAIEALVRAAEAEDRPFAAAEWWRRLAADDPYSSRAALGLVRALRAAGEHAAALRHADAHAELLRRELAVAPDPELLAFVERLRAEAAPRPATPLPATPCAGDGAGSAAEPAPADPPEAATAPPPPALPGQSASSTVSSPAPGGFAPPPAPEARPRRHRAWAAGGAALLVAAALWMGVLRPRPPSALRYDPRRIAVLYFDDDSPGGRLGYLAQGLTDLLIHELSQVPALEVVSRNGVKPYRDGTLPLDSVAARLRVGSMVGGSVQDGGDSVRVLVQLIDDGGRSLASRVIVRRAGDPLALEAALAEEVSGFLRQRLGEQIRLRETAAETESPRALELVLRAEATRGEAAELALRNHPLDERSVVELLAHADTLLSQAEALDPAWTRPAVLRGEVALSLARRAGGARQPALLARGVDAADRVLARHPRHAPALALRGLAVWRLVTEAGDTAGQAARLHRAEADLRAAVAADPSLASAWGVLSQVLRLRGAFAESDLAARRALAEDAYLDDAAEILLRLYYAAMAQGDYATARRDCAQGRRQLPGDWRFVECRLTLLREDHAQQPDPALAWRLVAELDRLDPPGRASAEGRTYSPLYRRVSAAAVLARAGASDSARAVLARAHVDAERMAVRDPDVRASLWLDEAYVRVLLGERGEARRLLEAYLRVHPAFADYVRRDVLFRGVLPEIASPAPAPAPGAGGGAARPRGSPGAAARRESRPGPR